jgi:glutathione S-transferase
MSKSERMQLHWSPLSPYVRKVMICAHELKLADRLELVRSVAAMSDPNETLMKDNPLAKIPTLVLEDGRERASLFDSIVICEYLDALHGGPRLFPREHGPRFSALRWHALADGWLDVLILWRNERGKPPARQTPEWLAGFELKTRAVLDRIEGQLTELEALPFGIGQITLGCALGYADYRFADLAWRDGHPRTARWFALISERASFQATLPREG